MPASIKSKKMIKLFFVRHGQAETNLVQAVGRNNSANLTEKGVTLLPLLIFSKINKQKTMKCVLPGCHLIVMAMKAERRRRGWATTSSARAFSSIMSSRPSLCGPTIQQGIPNHHLACPSPWASAARFCILLSAAHLHLHSSLCTGFVWIKWA